VVFHFRGDFMIDQNLLIEQNWDFEDWLICSRQF